MKVLDRSINVWLNMPTETKAHFKMKVIVVSILTKRIQQNLICLIAEHFSGSVCILFCVGVKCEFIILWGINALHF